MVSKHRRELDRIKYQRAEATKVTVKETEKRVPLAGFEDLYEITRGGEVFSKRLNRYIKPNYNEFFGSTYISIQVAGQQHNISIWEAVFNSYLTEEERLEFEELVSKIPSFILEDKYNIYNKAYRYLTPYIKQFDLPLKIFEDYLMVNKPNRELIPIADERKFRYIELGTDDLKYILKYDCGKYRRHYTTSEVADMMGLGTIREANKLLLAWNLQEKVDGSYMGLIDNQHWTCVGHYFKLVWYFGGIKIIYDKAIEKGHQQGGDEEFVDIIKRETNIFDF